MFPALRGRAREGRLAFALELQLAPACMRPRASPSARTIQTKPLVVEVFSSLLPQSSLGPVFVSNFACGGSSPRRHVTGRVFSLPLLVLLLPFLTPPPIHMPTTTPCIPIAWVLLILHLKARTPTPT